MDKFAKISLEDVQALANKGDADAQYELSYRYGEGERGVEQDLVKSAEWTRKAAEQGHGAAQFNLGFYFMIGSGVQRDYLEAAKWASKSALQDNRFGEMLLPQIEEAILKERDEAKYEAYRKITQTYRRKKNGEPPLH